MTIDELLNKLAKELPDGAQVQLCVENGAGWVNAQDWDGNEWDGENADASIEQRAIDALDWCNEREAIKTGCRITTSIWCRL